MPGVAHDLQSFDIRPIMENVPTRFMDQICIRPQPCGSKADNVNIKALNPCRSNLNVLLQLVSNLHAPFTNSGLSNTDRNYTPGFIGNERGSGEKDSLQKEANEWSILDNYSAPEEVGIPILCSRHCSCRKD